MNTHIETWEVIDPWLYAMLSTDSTLAAIVGTRISNTLSPTKLAFPYITWEAASTRAVRGVGTTLLDTDNLYNIKAVTSENSWTQAASIARRIRELIDGTVTTVFTPVPGSLTCVWETEIRYPEVTEGVQYRHMGATYRIRANSF